MGKPQKKVLVFGVFDIFHEGHRFFLSSARALGDKLTVAIAPDEIVKKLKGKSPKFSLSERTETVSKSGLADDVVSGDKKLNSWNVIRTTRPDVIAFGYDQKSVMSEVETFLKRGGISAQIVTLEPYGDGSIHSSKILASN